MYFLKFGGKKRSRGHVACSPSARGGLPVWGLSGRGPLGELPGGALSARPRGTRGGLGCIRGSSQRECPLDTRRTRRAPGCGLRVKHSGTGGVLGDIRRKSPGGSTRGQVSRSEASAVNITRWTRGALGGFREGCVALGGFREEVLLTAHSDFSGEVSLAGLAAHSGASGRVASHSEAFGRKYYSQHTR